MSGEANGCRWIDGDVRVPGWSYCGAPTVAGPEGHTWCRQHRALVYRPASRAETDELRGLLKRKTRPPMTADGP